MTPIDESLNYIYSLIQPIDNKEKVDLLRSVGRILTDQLVAQINIPPHANSAMDGYAVQAGVAQQGTTLPVTQRIPAGKIGNPLKAGEAARIFTGAPVPPGADAVVMQENCMVNNGEITILQALVAGENVRAAGEDISKDSVVFLAGHRIRVQDIGVLANLGVAQVMVTRPLKIALLTTGDELQTPGSQLNPGQIYNSNYFALAALLQRLGMVVQDCGIVADTLNATEQVLNTAAQSADVIISSGGVSVGEEDHVKTAVERNGEIKLWKLAIKPGKPFAFGNYRGKPFFGLPGNPVSAFVTFLLLVRPYLLKMSGCTETEPRSFAVRCNFAKAESGLRQEYLRVMLTQDSRGEPVLELFDNQSSGVNSSLSRADGFAVLPPHTALKQGGKLQFIPFSELVN